MTEPVRNLVATEQEANPNRRMVMIAITVMAQHIAFIVQLIGLYKIC